MNIVLRQGEIVMVPFPFSDLSAVKTRPAVVVSNHKYKGKDVILCAVTSQKSGMQEVVINDDDLSWGNLPLASYARYGKVISMERNLISRVVAKVGKKKLVEIIAGLVGLVECD